MLTAAHCTQDARQKTFHPSQFLVKLGEFDVQQWDVGETDFYRVAAMKIHQRFVYRGFYNDIALFKLERDVVYSDYVQPICLPTPSQRSLTFAGQSAVVAGWGRTSHGRSITRNQTQTPRPTGQRY